MPGKYIIGIKADDKVLDMMRTHEVRIYSDYDQLKEIPCREQLVMEYLGDDIGSIVNDFIGRFSRDSNIGRKVWGWNLAQRWVQCRMVDEEIGSHYGAYDHWVKLHNIVHTNNENDVWMPYQSMNVSFKHPRDYISYDFHST